MNLEVSSWILVKCLQHHLPIWINLSCTKYSPIIQGSSCMIQTLLALSILCAGLPRNKGKNILPTLLDKIKTMCLLFQCNWKKKRKEEGKQKGQFQHPMKFITYFSGNPWFLNDLAYHLFSRSSEMQWFSMLGNDTLLPDTIKLI